jgi:4-diphosphocytidyl-2-C-methyl-D-erythritol kinase
MPWQMSQAQCSNCRKSIIEILLASLYNRLPMPVTVRSFAKINLGLSIGPLRPDGYHELRTVYQTIALHDILRVEVKRGMGIEIRSKDPRVPQDPSNTCYRIVELAMTALKAKGRVVIEIDKRLPVQGGLGGASGNAVAALLALERALKKQLSGPERLRIAAEVGSDLPLFLIGGTVLGVGHGEEVYPLPDLPSIPCVVATPEIAVSTPKAFADWDAMAGGSPPELKPSPGKEGFGKAEAVPLQSTAELRSAWTGQRPVPTQSLPTSAEGGRPHTGSPKLTLISHSDRMIELGRRLAAWLSVVSGVPGSIGRGRAGSPLLGLVRTGIENDFERVVFPQYPELREVKSVLQGSGAAYASLSGSGSATYGLFGSRIRAEKAAAKLCKEGIPAVATATLTRRQYWKAAISR